MIMIVFFSVELTGITDNADVTGDTDADVTADAGATDNAGTDLTADTGVTGNTDARCPVFLYPLIINRYFENNRIIQVAIIL